MRLALALMFLSPTALAAWDRETYISTSTTSAASSQLRAGTKFVLCTVATYARFGSAASVVATVNDIPVPAGKPFLFEVTQAGRSPTLTYFAGILASGTGRCDIWHSDGGNDVPPVASASAGLTDAELRASAVPVSGTVAVTGVATQATLATMAADIALIKAKTDNLDVALSSRTKPSDTQPVSGTVAVTGANASQGVDWTGTARTIATSEQGIQYVSPIASPPANALSQRCNKVRTTKCQP